MDKKRILEIAKELDQAALGAKARGRITNQHKDFTVADAYLVQEQLWQRQKARGVKLVGRKMGMTSKAKMIQMNIDAPIHGFLTSEMLVQDGGNFSLEGKIHPKVEPEIAFLTKRELKGVVTADQALQALDGIALALEIIDSRFENYDFALADVIADNCSSCGFVVSSTIRKPGALAIENLGIVLEVGGKPAQFGSSAAILGDPLRSLLDLVRLLGEQGNALPAGSVVLAGGATAAVPLAKGQWVRARGEGLGTVEFFPC